MPLVECSSILKGTIGTVTRADHVREGYTAGIQRDLLLRKFF